MSKYIVIVALALSAACGSEDGPCDPADQTCEFEHAFAAYTMEAGDERDGLCMSWTLGNAETLWVNSVAIENNGAFHHSNWFFVPDNRWQLPDGHWDCGEHGFSELAATLFGGVLYAQSTQVTEETQQFHSGAAVRIPPYSRIIANTHLLNARDSALTTEMHVRLSTIPPAQVTAPLAPFRLTYFDLDLPARSRSEFGGACDLTATHERLAGGPLDLELHYILPHYHALGYRFELSQVGGDGDGDTLYEIDGAYGEPLGHTFAEPIDFGARGATGIRFACGYDNPGDESVGWGIGDQEMCVALGFAETAVAFDGTVDSGAMDHTAPDGTAIHTGSCVVNGTLFDQGTR